MGNRVTGRAILKLAWQVFWPVLFIETAGAGMVFLLYPAWDLQTVTILSDLLAFVLLYAAHLHAKHARYGVRTGEYVQAVRRRPVRTALFLALFAASSCVVLNEAVVLLGIENWSPGYGEAREILFSGGLWRQIFLMAVAAPLAEELIFRGICYERFRGHMGLLASAFWSALWFGIFHGNLVQGVYGFAVGLLLALVYEKYDGLGAAVWFHACANLTSIGLTGWVANLPSEVPLLAVTVFLFAAAAVMGNCIRVTLAVTEAPAGRGEGDETGAE